jgi:hypothetical protein
MNIILLCFILVPFGYLSDGILHQGHHLAFVLSFVVITGSLTKNKFLYLFSIYLSLWYIYICIVRMMYGIPAIYTVDATNALLYISIGMAIYTAVANSSIDKEKVYNVICATSLVQCALALMQIMGLDPILSFLNNWFNAQPLLDRHSPIGSLVNPNFLSAYVSITLPLWFRGRWKYLIGIPITVIILCKTTSAFIPAVIGCVYYFWPRIWVKVNKRDWYEAYEVFVSVTLLIVACVLYAMFSHASILDNPRWGMWVSALTISFANWNTILVGMGPGAGWTQPYPLHSEPVTMLYQYGIVGLALLAGFIVTVPRHNRMLYAAFIIAVINSFGNYPLHLSPSAFLIIIICGMISGTAGEREPAAPKGGERVTSFVNQHSMMLRSLLRWRR